MTRQHASQGSLFTLDFLTDSICNPSEWSNLTESAMTALQTELKGIFGAFRIDHVHTEADTESDLI